MLCSRRLPKVSRSPTWLTTLITVFEAGLFGKLNHFEVSSLFLILPFLVSAGKLVLFSSIGLVLLVKTYIREMYKSFFLLLFKIFDCNLDAF